MSLGKLFQSAIEASFAIIRSWVGQIRPYLGISYIVTSTTYGM